MVDSREQLFRCDFVGESVHVYAHVRAWDAPEALATFVAELERDRVSVPGEVRIVPVRGGPVAKVHYAPRAGARVAAPEPPAGG